MSETLLIMTVMFIGTADTTMGYLNDDLGWARLTMALCLDDISGFGSFEDREVDTHGYRLSSKEYDGTEVSVKRNSSTIWLLAKGT